MKIVILAGGRGSRLSDITSSIPKPLISINGKPIITRIVEHYSSYGFKDFIIPVGYKGEMIKSYFKNFDLHNSNVKITFKSKKIIEYEKSFKDMSFEVVNTGLESLTALRIYKIKNKLKNKTFMMTYGDGLSDVNLKDLLNFHNNHGKIATMTIIRPPARFGEFELNNKSEILNFKEKPKNTKGWINGGFFVFNEKIFDFISNKNEMLEYNPLNMLSKNNQLVGFKHEGFWQCIDTPRDIEQVEKNIKD